MEFRLEENTDWIRVFINGIVHLFLNKNRLIGFQSWKYGKEFNIEFTYEGASVFCSYETKEMWEGILSLFSDRLFPLN